MNHIALEDWGMCNKHWSETGIFIYTSAVYFFIRCIAVHCWIQCSVANQTFKAPSVIALTRITIYGIHLNCTDCLGLQRSLVCMCVISFHFSFMPSVATIIKERKELELKTIHYRYAIRENKCYRNVIDAV